MDMQLIGANKHTKIVAEQKSTDYINYYNHDVLDVHSYQKIRYKNIYPDIDWVLYVRDGKVEYEFEVRPGGDPDKIQMQLKWVEKSNIDASGNLHLENSMGKITDKAPETFQNGNKIGSAYVLNDKKLSFHIDRYDANQTLIIDPTLDWATYYGGTDIDYGGSCPVDALGNVYTSGYTFSSTNIASGGYQNTFGGGNGTSNTDNYLVKFNEVGIRQWATYYGGSSTEGSGSCAIDALGNVYLVGATRSTSGIAFGGFQNTYGGGVLDGNGDAYLVKFNSAGIRQWATYYGGTNNDAGLGCAIDSLGNIYMVGNTLSTNGIASGGYQNTFGGFVDVFLVKFDTLGMRQWATYYGGSDSEASAGCTIDPTGNIYLSGTTGSTSGIASGGFQNTYGGAISDAYFVKFNPAGVRQWATYYGGSGNDNGGSCLFDASGNIYFTGTTRSSNNIASGGYQNVFGGLSDIFLVKFNAAGIRLWGTYYGASNYEAGGACAMDASGNIYVSGTTNSVNGLAFGGYQNTFGGLPFDAFLVKFNASGIPQWCTYYGGPNYDAGGACTVDAFENIFMGGYTTSTSGIASGGFQNIYGGGTYDAFLVKFHECTNYTFTVNQTICEGSSFNGHTISGTYIDTFTRVNGCDSIRTIHLTVNPKIYPPITVSICQGASFGGHTASGIYVDTFISTLGGCDSIRTINLTVKPKSYNTITASICQEQNFNGYTTTGSYVDTFTAANGCDSIRTINLTVKPKSYNSITTSICQGENLYGYTASGTYIDTFTAANGCDSIRTINLTVKPKSYISITDSICQGGNLYGYTATGTYIDTFAAANGCDSIRTINLTVKPKSYISITDSICQGGNLYGYTATGIYIDTFTATNGCDSIRTIHLSVKPKSHTELDTILCYSMTFNWNGITIASAGDYYFTGTNVANCDSTVHISVVYTPTPIAVDSVITGCDQVMYSGDIYTHSTGLTDTFKNSLGCDSLYRNVTIHIFKTTHDTLHINLCQGESYDFNDRNFNTTTLTTAIFNNSNGCDSLITLDLKVHPLPDVTLTYEPHVRAVLCEGDTVALVGAGAKDYSYYNNAGNALQDRQRPVVKITADENHYFVKGTDAYGCSGQSEVIISAEACCNIMIPNAFSPNGDGLNDGFGVETLGHPYDFTLQVFNRWGKRVFISHDPKEKWDGTYNGGNMSIDTYYYIVTANCSNATPFKQKGGVSLIR